MFNSMSSSSSYLGQDSSYDRNKMSNSPAPPSHSPFSLSGSTSHLPHSSTSWNPSPQGSSSLNDSFMQPRSSYQQGYLMSMSQNNSSPQGTPRFEELPVVQTKAKLNSTLSRAPTVEFGKDPMFESSRKRQTLDEDAPPTASVNDIVNATYPDTPPSFSRKSTNFESSLFTSTTRPSYSTPQTTSDTIYVVVFGYPPDKYSVAVEYFKQLGDATEPDPNVDVANCFRIGYRQPADAVRAVRKNGEIIGGSWMVGAKWADPAQAENVLGQSVMRGGPSGAELGLQSPTSPVDDMAIDEPAPSSSRPSTSNARPTSTVGTPIRLAPSASAFRKPGAIQKTGSTVPSPAPGTPRANSGSAGGSPVKGVLGQFSDLVFGW
ncbi:hypothetical protein OF83DRAFT_1142171 [Amylostereum chailletii]|nr:hypothetical protein OF83DRAFT_1142171 [Amylostereum chailletii]